MSDIPSTVLGPGGEFDRLRAVFRRLGARAAGVGDDAALVTVDGVGLAVSCDMAVEDQHFRTAWIGPAEIGWRAAAAALSDLAAVAAQPLGVLAAVGVPPARAGAFLEDLMSGIADAAASVGAVLWGGDLVRAERVTVDVTVVGRAERPVRRAGARPGDGVWVTGRLGAPHEAVAAWKTGGDPEASLRERFARPVPRIAEAQWLRDRGATAMIDMSDGLAGDAGHLAAASRVQLLLEVDRVPVHPAVGDLQSAIVGGEEYELLTTLPEHLGAGDVAAFASRFRLELTRIGSVAVGQGLAWRRDGEPVDPGAGFSHF
jgi:thiamine-monophosphate kinase